MADYWKYQSNKEFNADEIIGHIDLDGAAADNQ